MNVDLGGSPPSASLRPVIPSPMPYASNFLTLFLQSRAEQFAALSHPATSATPPTHPSSGNTTHLSTVPPPTDRIPIASPAMGGGAFGGGSGGGGTPSAANVSPSFQRYTQPTDVPEKCFTFCSQRAESSPMCRMFCLRMRQPLPTQNEALARLRGSAYEESTYGTRPVKEQEAEQAGFFERMRQNLSPYSIIVVKGTPEGVVGRYMEEMDQDDGQHDFGALSRHAPAALRRKSTGGIEYMDWGPAGYLVHVPLTSVFWPILALPDNINRVIGPPTRFLTRYFETFSDGTQTRQLKRLGEELAKGSGFTFAGKVWEHHRAKIQHLNEQIEAKKEEAAEKAEKARQAADAARAAKEMGKEKDNNK